MQLSFFKGKLKSPLMKRIYPLLQYLLSQLCYFFISTYVNAVFFQLDYM